MPATLRQKEFIEKLLKKHGIEATLRYEDMLHEDLSGLISCLHGVGSRYLLPSVRARFAGTEANNKKRIEVYIERFKK